MLLSGHWGANEADPGEVLLLARMVDRMRRRACRANILRRIEELESRSIDGSGLVPDSPEWLAFWQQQVRLYEVGAEHVRLTLEGVRAVMQATPDNGDAGALAP